MVLSTRPRCCSLPERTSRIQAHGESGAYARRGSRALHDRNLDAVQGNRVHCLRYCNRLWILQKTVVKDGRDSLKNIIACFVLMLMLLPAAAFAEDPLMERPHWSLEIKGGTFAPVLENWSQFYG